MAWMIYRDESSYLAHHGIKGQKWGIRRYQNPDGSLTSEGKHRYGSFKKDYKAFEKTKKRLEKEGSDYATKKVYGDEHNMYLYGNDKKLENRWINARYEYTYRKLREDPSYKKMVENYLKDDDFNEVFSTKIKDMKNDIDMVKTMNAYIDWLYE